MYIGQPRWTSSISSQRGDLKTIKEWKEWEINWKLNVFFSFFHVHLHRVDRTQTLTLLSTFNSCDLVLRLLPHSFTYYPSVVSIVMCESSREEKRPRLRIKNNVEDWFFTIDLRRWRWELCCAMMILRGRVRCWPTTGRFELSKNRRLM